MIKSIESFAFDNIKKRHPKLVKNGLQRAIKKLPSWEPGDWRVYFIPDGTLVRKQDKTLVLFEIEDTHKISPDKMNQIIGMSCMLYDTTGYHTEVVVTDRYGIEEKTIYQSRDHMW